MLNPNTLTQQNSGNRRALHVMGRSVHVRAPEVPEAYSRGLALPATGRVSLPHRFQGRLGAPWGDVRGARGGDVV